MTHACCGPTFWIYVAISLALVVFAGCMSGLTLGLMSLGLVDLEVLQKSGTEKDKRHAAIIFPLVKNQHLLLCTLLIGNALAMEALPIFLDELVPSWGAILISVSLILIFAEILPQAVCTRYGLLIGAAAAPLVRILVILFFPVAYPISKLLDWFLGHKNEGLFRRAELSAFVHMHAELAGKGGDLSNDEATIIAGALDMANKTAEQVMTPIAETFSLDINTKLDAEILNQLMLRGHSRVPVYSGDKSNIFGLLLVKNLLNVRPEDNLVVRNLTIRKLPRVSVAMPLYDLLNDFQKGHSHIAAVVRTRHVGSGSSGTTLGLLPRESGSLSPSERSLLREGSPGGEEAMASMPASVDDDSRPTADGAGDSKKEESLDNAERGEARLPTVLRNPSVSYIRSPSRSPPHLRSSQHRQNTAGEGDLKVSAGSASSRASKKWEHTGSGRVLLLQEPESYASVPFLPEDQEVVGIVTMEDVIEELLQEEILDETDEYMSVHNRVEVPPSGEVRGPVLAPPLRMAAHPHSVGAQL